MKVVTAGPGTVCDMRGATVAVGNFDGLHRGHLALFSDARQAAASGQPVGVVTFAPHPVKVLAPHLAPPAILRPDEKESGLRALHIDVLYVIPFDAALAALSPQAFIDDVLIKRLGVVGVVVGAGFRFGVKARGSIADLRLAFGANAREVAVVTVASGHQTLTCSSTRIRDLVSSGDVVGAASVLGYPYFVEGEVVHGDARGRTIGVRTANVESRRELLPRMGVYATRALLPDGTLKGSVTNIGLSPTFQTAPAAVAGRPAVRIESHIFDLDVDLYGQSLRLEFVGRIRDEQKFVSVDALRTQIQADIASAQALIAASSPASSPWRPHEQP